MSDFASEPNINTPHQQGGPRASAVRTTQCVVCRRRLRWTIYRVEEPESVPAPRQSWMLCQGCHEAVVRQLRQTAQNEFRLRVAVGLVASERGEGRLRVKPLEERLWEWIFPLTLLITIAIHIAFVFVVLLAR